MRAIAFGLLLGLGSCVCAVEHRHGRQAGEEQTLRFVRENLPERARELEVARSLSTELYNDELARLGRHVDSLNAMKQLNPERFRLVVSRMRSRRSG